MRRTTLPATALLLTILVLGAGCDADPTSEPAPEADLALVPGEGILARQVAELAPEIRQEVASLRRLTAPFHSIETGMAAGWSAPLTPCLWHPTDGAMGYHYGNMALLDGEVAVLEPETLLYEPRKNGDMRLVAVEYLVPFAILPPDADPPELLGQHFHQNHTAGVWALHVWIWRDNPSGLFADWNQNVTCDWAT